MSQLENREFGDKIAAVDLLIRQGRTAEAIQVMSGLPLTDIERRYRLPMARLYRRLGMNSYGLKCLTYTVRPISTLDQPATNDELCEYGVLLSRIGNVGEAKTILQGVDSSKSIDALMFLSFCHISEWNYVDALPLLQEYERQIEDDYKKLIAQVNQVACLVSLESFDEAAELVDSAIAKATFHSAVRLKANLLELKAQVSIGRAEYNEAEAELNEASHLLQQAGTYDEIFVTKWKAYIDSTLSGSSKPLLRFREKAVQAQQWEAVRDVDFLSLKISFDSDRYLALIAGSASPFYKDRVVDHFKREVAPFYGYGDQSAEAFDLNSGAWGELVVFRPGFKMLTLLKVLASDLYYPIPSGAIHGHLYPDEYFNIFSTPLKIRQQIFRLRDVLKKNKIPIEIENHQESYSLRLMPGIQLKVSTYGNYDDAATLQLRSLQHQVGSEFSATRACELLNLSRTHFLRLVQGWIDEGRVRKIGEGRGTRYQIDLQCAYKG